MMPRPTDQIVVLISPMLQCITISEMIHPMIDIQDCHLPETLDHPLSPQVSPLLGDAIILMSRCYDYTRNLKRTYDPYSHFER